MQNIKALLALTKYIFLANIRNPSAVFFGFVFPFIFIVAFGLIGQGGGIYSVGVLPDSEKSGFVYEALNEVDVLNLQTDRSETDLKDDLVKGKISATLQIVKNINSPETELDDTYSLNLNTSSASPNEGSIVASILTSITNEINNQANPNRIEIANLNIENVEGRKYTQIDFILPGQLNFALLSTGVFTVAFSLLTLRRTLVLKRMYATPTPRWTILIAKVLSSLMIALLQASVIILVGHFLFNFTLINGVATFIGMILLSLVGLLVFLGLGLVVSSVADNEDAASPVANLVTLPQFILSGSFFSVEAFPEILQGIAKILPMTFLNNAMRSIAFEGSTLTQILPDLAGLAVWGVIFYLIAFRIFKWE